MDPRQSGGMWRILLIVGLLAAASCGSGGISSGATESTPPVTTTTTPTPAPTPMPGPVTTAAAVSVSPSSGIGAGRTFTFAYADSDSTSHMATTEVVIVSGNDATAVNGCSFYGTASQLWLRNDAQTGLIGPATFGSADTLSNAACTLTAAASAISSTTNTVTMTVRVTFKAAFAGTKTVFMRATDRTSISSPWTAKGTWTVSPLNPQPTVITSSCTDAALNASLDARNTFTSDGQIAGIPITPACFASYDNLVSLQGYYVRGDRRPLPIMGRTCGHFDILAVLIDTPANRQKLLSNAAISASVKAKVTDGRVQEAMTELLASYTTAAIMSANVQMDASKAIDFSFSAAVTTATSRTLDLNDVGLGFASHDAVIVIDDLGTNAAHGVERWPSLLSRPVFYGRDGGFVLHIDPFWLAPGLFGHELLHRNLPVYLSELQIGPTTLVVENGVTFDRTPIINPRTGENIEPFIRANAGQTPLVNYIAGYADVDGDGMMDCIDPEITPTPNNIDGDFIPDRFDPDLSVNHRPLTWMFAERGGFVAAIQQAMRSVFDAFDLIRPRHKLKV